MCNAVWDIYVIQSENFYHYRLWSLSHSCHTHPSSFPTFMSFRFLLWSAEFNPAVCENNVLAPGGLTSPSWSFFQSFLFIIFHDRLSLSYWGWSWTCSSPALPSQVGEITCIIRIIRSNLWDFSLLPGILSWQRVFFLSLCMYKHRDTPALHSILFLHSSICMSWKPWWRQYV